VLFIRPLEWLDVGCMINGGVASVVPIEQSGRFS